MNTTENNKLIAEFLHGENATHPNQYHENWNELMQVIQKILDISLKLDSMEMYYNITDSIPEIKNTYEAVVEFIKWYNQQKN